ncbi:MAG: glycosyltransferase family 2 protein [Pirellulales bacterium]
MGMSLTVIIPCKDEAKNIRQCIESVRSIADEIIVADSGSRDSTLEIVRSVGGCRIIQREYVNSANFKNWAIPQAAHPWVLVVDADERVTPELAAEIRKVLSNPDESLDGYWIWRDNHFLGYPIRHGGWGNDKVLRLFRRDASRYQQRWVHAEVELPRARVGRLQNRFVHFTTWQSDHYMRKLDRYATWGALNLRDEGKKPNLLRMFAHFPVRFLHLYVIRRGFLDGVPGFQVCMMLAFYGLLKQFRLWEQFHALTQPDPEANVAATAHFPKASPPSRLATPCAPAQSSSVRTNASEIGLAPRPV